MNPNDTKLMREVMKDDAGREIVFVYVLLYVDQVQPEVCGAFTTLKAAMEAAQMEGRSGGLLQWEDNAASIDEWRSFRIDVTPLFQW